MGFLFVKLKCVLPLDKLATRSVVRGNIWPISQIKKSRSFIFKILVLQNMNHQKYNVGLSQETSDVKNYYTFI